MNPVEYSKRQMSRFERTFLFASVVGACVVSIPNIYLAAAVSTYPEFWSQTLGNKPMHPAAMLICRASYFYCATSILFPLAALWVAFLPGFIQTSIRIAIAAAVFGSLQLFLSLYLFWLEWATATVNARIYP